MTTSWDAAFVEFHARFAHIFQRAQSREQSGKYVRGLMSKAERKNGWQLAEAIGDATPDRTQRLLYNAQWDADQARDILMDYVVDQIGDEDGIGIVDETGFIKKGNKSAGVARQYTGTAGKIENSQVGTFLAYATAAGHTLIDRRLFLPEAWVQDAERRNKAHIPVGVVHETKPEQAVAMLRHAWARGVKMKWVTGDEVYGSAGHFRDAVANAGKLYVMAVTKSTPVWQKRPKTLAPDKSTPTLGRPKTREKVAAGQSSHQTVSEVVVGFQPACWQRLTTSIGSKGPIEYDWAMQRVVERSNNLPGRDAWLLARRSCSNPDEIAYYLSNAHAETSLDMLCKIAAQRFRVEQCFEETKGETGLDHYEVRFFHSWYRHITMSMMAHAWLMVMRREANQDEPNEAVPPKKRWSPTRSLKHASC